LLNLELGFAIVVENVLDERAVGFKFIIGGTRACLAGPALGENFALGWIPAGSVVDCLIRNCAERAD
jgi:hypothetical protein